MKRETDIYLNSCVHLQHCILARSELLCVTGLAAGKGQHRGHISVVYRSRSKGCIGKGLGAEASHRGEKLGDIHIGKLGAGWFWGVVINRDGSDQENQQEAGSGV